MQGWFIEFVRSKMMTTCAGLGFPPRMDAVAFALIVNVSIPSRPAKNVFVGARSCTTTAFTGSQPPSETTHFVVTVVVTGSMSPCSFLLPGDELYSWATAVAAAAFGSSWAAASAAASAEAWSERLA